ncbi:MAG: ADP-heptose--LPS heptosyltransferase RfaF [Cytophagaceae bacterium]|nr:ADP-heptose--LPS heptosyltransferase RfaF [Cytophagaceae bacterium]
MGDVAMTVPVLIALTRKYPKLNLHVVSKPFFEPIFEGIPNLTFYAAKVKDEHKGIPGLYKLYKVLATAKINEVADLHNVLRSKIIDQFFKLSGIKTVAIDKGRSEKKELTRDTDKKFRQLKTTHQRYADVFSRLGYPITLQENEFLKKRNLTYGAREMLGNSSHKWLGIAPFAAHEGKQYPLELMQEVIDQVYKDNGCRILLFGGGKTETKLLEDIAAKNEQVLCVAGRFDFTEELAIISQLDCMLSMDSGNGHLAAMFGIPVVTLWGVTHPFAGFAPYAQPEENLLLADRKKFPLVPTSIYGNALPRGYEGAIRTITPKTIVKRVLEILG